MRLVDSREPWEVKQVASVPKVGDTQLGRLLGKSNTNRFIWSACKGCGKERWVKLRNGNAVYELCPSCASHYRKKTFCKTKSIMNFVCPKCGKPYCIGWKSFLKWARRHEQSLDTIESYQGTSRICRNCVVSEVGSRNIWKAIANPRKINHKSNNDASNLEIHSQMTHLTITELMRLMRQVQQLEAENKALRQELGNVRIYA